MPWKDTIKLGPTLSRPACCWLFCPTVAEEYPGKDLSVWVDPDRRVFSWVNREDFQPTEGNKNARSCVEILLHKS